MIVRMLSWLCQVIPSRAVTLPARMLLEFSSLSRGTSTALALLRPSDQHLYSGFNFGYSAWLNSKFLGSNQGTNQYSSGGGVDMTNDTWTFDAADLNDGDNVVTVVVDPTGLEEDYNGQDTFKVSFLPRRCRTWR